MLINSSPWSNPQIPGIRSSLLALRGREVLERLGARGLRVPQPNRINNAVRLTEDLNAGRLVLRPEDAKLQRRALEAFRTIFEAFVIVWAAEERKRRVNAFPNDRLARLLEGAELPSDDRNPLARNTQFELYVGASLVLGGLEALPSEPDYRTVYWGETIGIPAKRLTSVKPETLRGQLRAGARQLATHGLRGLVALSLDPWVDDLSGDTAEEVGQKFNTQIQLAHQKLQEQSEKRAVMGAIIFANWSQFRFDAEKPVLDWRTPTQIIAFTDTQEELDRVRAFQDGWRARYENSLAELGALLNRRASP
jgi:hypothetical protein